MKFLNIFLISIIISINGCGYSTESYEETYTYEETELPISYSEPQPIYQETIENSELISDTEEMEIVEEMEVESTTVMAMALVEEPKSEKSSKPSMIMQLPKNSIKFPHPETGYGWQITDTSDLSVWFGVSIKGPNKLGNYEYNIHATSNYYLNDSIIESVIIVGMDITIFDESKYLMDNFDNKRELKKNLDKKEQLLQKEDRYQDEYLKDVDVFEKTTMIITKEELLIFTFFLPSDQEEIIITWDGIKKIDVK